MGATGASGAIVVPALAAIGCRALEDAITSPARAAAARQGKASRNRVHDRLLISALLGLFASDRAGRGNRCPMASLMAGIAVSVVRTERGDLFLITCSVGSFRREHR